MILESTTWKSVRGAQPEAAILPWGATEAHNYHLPYATDNYQVTAIATRCAEVACATGAQVVVLPTIPFGVNTQQLDIPLTINMNPSTQEAVLADVVESLEGDVDRLVILNGHGGNHFRQMVRELQTRSSVFISVVDWFRTIPPEDFFEEDGDHAGELETSLMMHLHPELVLPLSEAGSGHARSWRIQGFRDGIAWAPRPWTQVTDDTGVGDPSRSSAAKGQAYFMAVTSVIAEFLIELCATPTTDLFE